MTPVYLALGGNLGSVDRAFDLALEKLAALPGICVGQHSSTYRFPSVGKNAGGKFSNAAARVDTALEPLDLLEQLQKIESDLGRVRGVRWGPRPLDLDLIFFGDRVIDLPRLRVPHPACWYRRFVLDPLHEIASTMVHPEQGATVSDLRERLLTRPLPVSVVGSDEAVCLHVVSQLSVEFPDVSFRIGAQSTRTGQADREPALTFWLGDSGRAESPAFQLLPVLSRLDASLPPGDRIEFLRDTLHAALGR